MMMFPIHSSLGLFCPAKVYGGGWIPLDGSRTISLGGDRCWVVPVAMDLITVAAGVLIVIIRGFPPAVTLGGSVLGGLSWLLLSSSLVLYGSPFIMFGDCVGGWWLRLRDDVANFVGGGGWDALMCD